MRKPLPKPPSDSKAPKVRASSHATDDRYVKVVGKALRGERLSAAEQRVIEQMAQNADSTVHGSRTEEDIADHAESAHIEREDSKYQTAQGREHWGWSPTHCSRRGGNSN